MWVEPAPECTEHPFAAVLQLPVHPVPSLSTPGSSGGLLLLGLAKGLGALRPVLLDRRLGSLRWILGTKHRCLRGIRECTLISEARRFEVTQVVHAEMSQLLSNSTRQPMITTVPVPALPALNPPHCAPTASYI